jgi:hypothetical protein
MPSKLLRGNAKIPVVDYGAFADPTHPTSAELNSATLSFDISCAVLDDYTLNLTDSDTDDTLTVCDIGNVQSRTFTNYEGELTGLRDADITNSASVYNTFYHLFQAPDIKYWVVKRIGPSQATTYAAGQVISMYGFTTDYPTNNADDGSMLSMTANLKPTGDVNVNYTLVA